MTFLPQLRIPATYMRGGTSKGVFFRLQDLPAEAQVPGAARDALLMRVIGSPDPYGKHTDGMGGATSSTSKCVIISAPSVPDHDVDYLYGQVSIDTAFVDWSGNCGNLSTAVGPFAISNGLIDPARVPHDGTCTVRIWQANIGKTILAHVPIVGGQVQETGDFELDGVTFPAAEVQLDLTQRTLASRQESYDLVKRRFDGGVASELDLNQSKTLLDTASSDLAQLARARAQALNALVLLVGAPLPEDLPAPATFGRDQLLATVPSGLPSDLLERRPDIVAAENQLKAANANIGAARAAFFPTISLTGLLGVASPSLGDLFKGGQGYWSFSPSITTPLFAGGSIREGLNLAKARDNIAVAQYEQSIQQAFREVSDALAGEATYGAQLDAQRALQDSSARTLELSNLRYTNGIDSYLQVQTAQVDFFNAQLSLVQTGLAALINRVELYKALGGGWEETTKEPTKVTTTVQ